MCNLFGSSDTKNLQNWQSPFVNSGSLNSSLSSLSTPSSYLTGFSGGGITGSYDPSGNSSVSIDPTRAATVSGLGSTFANAATQYGTLASQWAPGSSALRTAQLNDLQSQQNAAMSNLQQNLQNRRVLGSSFAQAQADSTGLAYQQQRDTTQATDYQTELQNTAALVQAQQQASAGVYQTALNESNLEAGVAGALQQESTNAVLSATTAKANILGTLANGAQTQQGQDQRTAAQLDEQSSAGVGSLFGSLMGMSLPGTVSATGAAVSGGSVGGSLLSALPMLLA